MQSSPSSVLAVLLACVLASAGCNRNNNAELAQAKPDTNKASAESAKQKETQTELGQDASSPDRKAAEWVLQVDGSVKVVADGMSLVVDKGGNLPDESLKVVEIALSSPKASDDGTATLKGLKDLRALRFVSTGGGAPGINETSITKFDFLETLPPLETLEAEGISDAQVQHVRGLTNLKTLRIGFYWGNPKISDNGLGSLKDLKQLEALSLYGCNNVTDAGLEHLTRLVSLRSLDLEHCSQISDAGLEHVKRLSQLQELRLGSLGGPESPKVTEAGVKSLQAALPNCNIIAK